MHAVSVDALFIQELPPGKNSGPWRSHTAARATTLSTAGCGISTSSVT